MMKLIRIAYFRFLERNCGVTSPMRDSMVSASGSSKTRPKASVNLMMKSTWLDTEIIGWMPCSLPKLSRNCSAKGTTTRREKAAPITKRSEPMSTKGAANRRSCR
jgi:hypothetical protein